jgi:type II secretory pathway component PulF
MWQDFVSNEVAILLSFLAIVIVGVLLVVLPIHARRGRDLVRRSVLAQLELATSRGLPLMPALEALAGDFARRIPPARPGCLDILLFPFLPRLALRFFFNRNRSRGLEAINDVGAVLREGDLRKALEAAPAYFPAPLPELLGAAENQGALGPTLAAVGELEAASERFRADVRGRLVYPVGLLIVVELVGVLVVLGTRSLVENVRPTVVPDAKLSALLAVQPLIICLAPLLLAALWTAAGAFVPGEGVVSRSLRRLPFVARPHGLARVSLYARTIGAFLRSGATLPEALRAASPDAFDVAANRASEGAGLARALEGSEVVPRDAASFLATAGDGAPAETLAALAGWAEGEHRERVGALARAVVPLALVVLGTLVASIYWPPFLVVDDMRSVVGKEIPW